MNKTRARNAGKFGLTAGPLVLALLSGCASQPIATFQPFTPEDLNGEVNSGAYKQKVDSFFVVMDASSSMDEIYRGGGLGEAGEVTKFSIEKEFLNRMNQTIPNLSLDYGLRSFGFGSCLSWNFTRLNTPMGAYSPSAFQSSLDSVDCASGGTPLAEALDASAGDLQPTQGKVAMIVVSDGKQTLGDPWKAAQRLKSELGDRLCLYSVWVGNPGDRGEMVMKSLPAGVGCGSFSRMADVVSSAGAAKFVKEAFLQRGEPVAQDCSTRDADSDGVNDCHDQCPDTPAGAKVDASGCWVLRDVLFDFDQSTIKPSSYPSLDAVVKVFERTPGLRVEIDGHTDSDGSDAYNMALSQRRAEAVRAYLIEHGITEDRLTARGFGESRPVADNATEEGRALNRRVELTVLQ